ncbi:hypothetical protein ABZ348_17180 [Streptomyces sp. NPDC005963]|uniref:hypothetical protein n=1 Tax=Streptomyces sp. NPDC005963 TaxID=3156721 RepID=UPI0033D5DB2B
MSGEPPCGAELENARQGLTPEDAQAWAECHFRTNGHRNYTRGSSDTGQWNEPADVDPQNVQGVTT